MSNPLFSQRYRNLSKTRITENARQGKSTEQGASAEMASAIAEMDPEQKRQEQYLSEITGIRQEIQQLMSALRSFEEERRRAIKRGLDERKKPGIERSEVTLNDSLYTMFRVKKRMEDFSFDLAHKRQMLQVLEDCFSLVTVLNRRGDVERRILGSDESAEGRKDLEDEIEKAIRSVTTGPPPFANFHAIPFDADDMLKDLETYEQELTCSSVPAAASTGGSQDPQELDEIDRLPEDIGM